MKINFLKTAILAVAVSTVVVSCSDDFVDTKFYQDVEQAPLTSLNEVESFERGMYTSMRATAYYGRDYGIFAEVRSDEMYSNGYAGYYNTVYNYTMTSADAYSRDTYRQIYTAVAKANILINTDVNGIKGTESQRDAVRFHIGQAHALRALFFFDLLKLYGQKYTGGTLGIVTPLKYDPKAMQARGTIAENEAQIEADFVKGLQMMEAYPQGAGPLNLSTNAVKALMSRFYLYKKDYAKVRTLVADIANSYQVMPAASYAGSWSSPTQNNSVFELAVGVPGSNGTDSWGYILNYDGYGNVVMEESLYNSYAANDVRKSIIEEIDAEYYIYKYPNLEGTDNIKIVRIEEVLLNGVEAELNGGSATTALNYYNRIITNRGLTAASAVDMTTLKLERAKELVGEGFRLWDLLRWGDAVPRPAGASTNNQLTAFPIPRIETDVAGTLVTANPGYDN
ncbi:RagB/SusD family nutrient uptake outer membrane protein [Chryseobacterium sp. Ch-15]|uniref:RagB/SusD family nutrient uptake outer membrane protein n=1 Tax=Chryseobacterium muglaense TaxID=2893752 RepID=A0A9Q3UUL1_9FLAO|nr:RagB/SusD family nutrient uptake outer membrane protein [Chryseobacterium muglaense]MBD3903803.1 RagB/SusD family nutrient uptake outer membrane protein [Chryseobacterium muglaense]MCC9034877.1 RagB/SusD family nutrient uptake outer membrane protein [Chryseobacterium muglaense]MCM2553142.1 RagB/SusD family nutrient uptake outer membrane protein [Chryseobacterium muglaense]